MARIAALVWGLALPVPLLSVVMQVHSLLFGFPSKPCPRSPASQHPHPHPTRLPARSYFRSSLVPFGDQAPDAPDSSAYLEWFTHQDMVSECPRALPQPLP